MTSIGLLSDTHGYIDDDMLEHFKSVDEIWHAGDFGTITVSEKIAAFKPLRGVFGNIDGNDIRKIHPRELHFKCENLNVFIIHIGGYPPKYEANVREKIQLIRPDIFICGHSHILKVVRDKNLNNLIHLNPGAAGKSGFHKFRTMMRFKIDGNKMTDLVVIELGLRGSM